MKNFFTKKKIEAKVESVPIESTTVKSGFLKRTETAYPYTIYRYHKTMGWVPLDQYVDDCTQPFLK